ERRDFRDLAPGFRVVLDPFARVCPVFTEIRAPPDGLTMPFTRGGRVDDPARRVVDHVVHGPAFTERAAQLPRLPVVALEEKGAFARPNQQQCSWHRTRASRVGSNGLLIRRAARQKVIGRGSRAARPTVRTTEPPVREA